jgi:integrase
VRSRKRRGPRGQGTIFPNRGGWTARRTIAGVRVERWGRTQAEALQKIAQASPPGPKTTVAEYGERWLASLEVAPKTKDSYTTSVRRYFAPTIGHRPVAALTVANVEELAKALKASGLRPGTVLLALRHLHTMMNAAVREGVATRNPVALARKPKAEPAEIDPFTPEELNRIYHAALRHERTWVVALLATTGMRDGEAIALNVTDFDARAGTLAITKTYLNRKHGVGDRPKSKNSLRTIQLSPEAAAVAKLAAGKRKSGLLFPSKSITGPKSHGIIRSAWLTLLSRLKIRARVLHQLRHSVISHLVAAGHPIADVARYCGNTPAVIVKTYLHPTRADTAGAIHAMLGGSGKRRG